MGKVRCRNLDIHLTRVELKKEKAFKQNNSMNKFNAAKYSLQNLEEFVIGNECPCKRITAREAPLP